jgi:hypothetical protein
MKPFLCMLFFSWQPILISVLFSLFLLHAYIHVCFNIIHLHVYFHSWPVSCTVLTYEEVWFCDHFVFILHFFQALFISILSPLPFTLLSETFQSCVLYVILIFHVHSPPVLWFKLYISVHLCFISLYLSHNRLCLSTVHLTLSLLICLSISVTYNINSSFYSLPHFCVQQILWQFALVQSPFCMQI